MRSLEKWLAEGEALAAKASKPWLYSKRGGVHRVSTCEPGHETFQERVCDMTSPAWRGTQTEDDGLFIADARSRVVKQAAIIRVMREALEAMRECDPNYGARQVATKALAEADRIAEGK